MRKYAFLSENTVTKVESIEESQYSGLAREYQLIIDIEDLIVCPQVGWVLSGNSVVPGNGQVVSMKELVKSKLRSYQEIAPELLIDMYATNTLTGMTAAQSDSSFTSHEDVIFVLCQGAFPTAIYRLNRKVTEGSITRELADSWIALIQAYL
jgi:hypothetical protein